VRLLPGGARGAPQSASQPLAPPADARFNGAVRFVYRHENVIRVVLTETRKVYSRQCLLGMVRVISEICGAAARRISAIAYKVAYGFA